MPQVDLDTLVSACAGAASCDNKIACETLANTDTTTATDNPNHNQNQESEIPPDLPPESFWLSKDAEFDWFDRNAFYERKDSQKGNSNSTNLNPNLINSSSQRYSSTLKSKASIIGLPKIQKTTVDTTKKRNCKQVNTTRSLFPKRSGSTGNKSDSAMNEPSSPKVSCMGRVRSKRDRRRMKQRQRSVSEPETLTVKPDKRGKSGLLASFRAIFRSRSGLKKDKRNEILLDPVRESSTASVAAASHDMMDRLPRSDLDARVSRKSVDGHETAAEPLGLGGMMRFTSGRRSDAWADEARNSVDGREPAGLGGMMRFTSGRRSDAWADEVTSSDIRR